MTILLLSVSHTLNNSIVRHGNAVNKDMYKFIYIDTYVIHNIYRDARETSVKWLKESLVYLQSKSFMKIN